MAWRRADSLSPKHPDNLPFLLKFYLTSLHVLFVYLDYKYVKNSIMYLHPHSTYQRVIHILINSGEKNHIWMTPAFKFSFGRKLDCL